MTNDLRHGLNLLADEVDPSPVDTDDIIAKARTRTRNQRAGLASALGTVAVAGAMAATIAFGAGDPGDGERTATSPTKQTVSDRYRICTVDENNTCVPQTETNDQSRKLTQQLASARKEVLPPRLLVVQDRLLPRPLEFAVSGPDQYTARATLADEHGTVWLIVEVRKVPVDAPLDVPGRMLVPCTLGPGDCEQRSFGDGTVAWAETHNEPSAMQPNTDIVVLRPDGTYVAVLASVDEVRQDPPLTVDELFRFATVFTY